MTRGTKPHEPPYGIRKTLVPLHPSYCLKTDVWRDLPVKATKNDVEKAFYDTKKSNDEADRITGDPIVWNYFITFGYHMYKHSYEFETQWQKRSSKTEHDMYWFIWTTFRLYYENDITPDGKLVLWAKKIA